MALFLLLALTESNAQTNECESVGFRTWTSRGGDKLEGEFVHSLWGMVTLKKEDGSEVKIRRMQLIKADRDWIREFESREARERAEAGRTESETEGKDRKTNRLPVLADGKWKGYHAVYQHENFDAVVDSSARIRIYPKEEGKRVDKSLTVGLGASYYDRKAGYTKGRPVEIIESSSSPTVQPKEVVCEGKLRHNVKFGLYYEFNGNEISARAWCKDPRSKAHYPTNFRISVSIPKSHDIPPDMRLSQQEELLRDYTFVVDTIGRKKIVYSYDKPAQMRIKCRAAEIVGPLFGSRKVRFKAKSPKEAWLYPHIYSKNAPWQGYGVRLYKKDNTTKSKSHKMILVIE